MGRIICITGMFSTSTGRRELLVSHGIDEDTCRAVPLPCEHPQGLGAVFDETLQEWVLPASDARRALN